MKCFITLASVFLVLAQGYTIKDNEIETVRINTSEDLINSVISDCFETESPMSCLKGKVLSFLDTKVGVSSESARAFDEQNIDKVIFDRVGRILNTNEFRFQMPEFIFQNAEVTYRADRGLDVEFPEENDNGEARGLLKKKLLLPVLLLLKLKMKALMPILVAIIGIKAVKALILSKLAITLVVGFLVYNLIMKKGAMPMMMTPADASPAPQYGPPASQYGAPGSTPAAPQDSYSPQQWDPSNSGGPYARVWDASQLAYSSYYPDSSSSAAANQSPSYSSVASISSAVSSSSSSPTF